MSRASLTISRDLFYSTAEFIVRGEFRSSHGMPRYTCVRVYIYIYIVYTRRNYRATLFIVQIALWRLRCCSTLTRIVARYFTPVCQRDTHGSRLVECQNDVHIVALNATSCTKFRFNAFHRNFCLGSVCYNGIWIVTGSVAQLSCC